MIKEEEVEKLKTEIKELKGDIEEAKRTLIINNNKMPLYACEIRAENIHEEIQLLYEKILKERIAKLENRVRDLEQIEAEHKRINAEFMKKLTPEEILKDIKRSKVYERSTKEKWKYQKLLEEWKK